MIVRRPNVWQWLGHSFSTATKNISQTKPIARSSTELTAQHIDEVIQKQPHLCHYDTALWHSTFDALAQQGFTAANFVHIVSSMPSLLIRKPHQILETIEWWRSTQFGDQRVIGLLEQYPELFDLREHHALNARMAYLKQYAQTSKNIWRLFMNAPNLITDRESIIDAKIAYVRCEMRAEVSDVVKSTVFSHSLESIRCRHVFLDRLGIYKPRSPKVDPLEPNKNPRMHQIYDTSDHAFASRVCGVSPEEFEVFEKLFAIEVEKGQYSVVDEESYN